MYKKYMKNENKGDGIVKALLYNTAQPEKSVSEIEANMGFDTVCPVSLSVSDTDDFSQNPDEYKSWYEEELRTSCGI